MFEKYKKVRKLTILFTDICQTRYKEPTTEKTVKVVSLYKSRRSRDVPEQRFFFVVLPKTAFFRLQKNDPLIQLLIYHILTRVLPHLREVENKSSIIVLGNKLAPTLQICETFGTPTRRACIVLNEKRRTSVCWIMRSFEIVTMLANVPSVKIIVLDVSLSSWYDGRVVQLDVEECVYSLSRNLAFSVLVWNRPWPCLEEVSMNFKVISSRAFLLIWGRRDLRFFRLSWLPCFIIGVFDKACQLYFGGEECILWSGVWGIAEFRVCIHDLGV